MVQQASIRRSNAPIRIGVLLLITLDRAEAQTTVGAACTRRQKVVCADLSMRPRCASMLMATLEHWQWPVKARPGDNWLDMVVTNDIPVSVAIGTGLGSRYKLLTRTFQKRQVSAHLGLEHDFSA